MLKQRIITAVILVAVLLGAMFASNPMYWRVAISVAVLGAFYEWLRFCKIIKPIEAICAFALFLGLASMLFLFDFDYMLVVSAVCVLWVALLAFTFSDVFGFFHNKWVKLTVGVITLSVAGWLLIEFKSLTNGPIWIICFFLSVVAADVGAYFAGKRFGKTKLAPSISPGKTVEGFVGGLVLVSLIFVPTIFSEFSGTKAVGLLATVLLTAVVSVGGDLFESKLKRYVGLKDSSQILPGHGGILDRVDSLMAGVPVFALGLIMLGVL
ncbi:phosphatidate cytidylyltransferase [Arenicella sp. 4NH20-0111]|uniref:phosphatidate cytidylyltransferase n=1 Tax=Arenicella sp. 4NH20-0111 TaxID=3127648 RepID=UPI00310B0AE2